MAFVGNVSDEAIDALMADLMPYVEAASAAEPVIALSNASQAGKFSSHARRRLVRLNGDPRFGRFAVVHANRFGQVMGTFVMKVTGRDTIRFFDDEVEAIGWLRHGS